MAKVQIKTDNIKPHVLLFTIFQADTMITGAKPSIPIHYCPEKV
jgi:hypothetical protein